MSCQLSDATLLLGVNLGLFADNVALGERDVVALFAVAVSAEVAQCHTFPAVDDRASAFGDFELAASKLARKRQRSAGDLHCDGFAAHVVEILDGDFAAGILGDSHIEG